MKKKSVIRLPSIFLLSKTAGTRFAKTIKLQKWLLHYRNSHFLSVMRILTRIHNVSSIVPRGNS